MSRSDCFALEGDRGCYAVVNTRCRDCPFYKSLKDSKDQMIRIYGTTDVSKHKDIIEAQRLQNIRRGQII